MEPGRRPKETDTTSCAPCTTIQNFYTHIFFRLISGLFSFISSVSGVFFCKYAALSRNFFRVDFFFKKKLSQRVEKLIILFPAAPTSRLTQPCLPRRGSC